MKRTLYIGLLTMCLFAVQAQAQTLAQTQERAQRVEAHERTEAQEQRVQAHERTQAQAQAQVQTQERIEAQVQTQERTEALVQQVEAQAFVQEHTQAQAQEQAELPFPIYLRTQKRFTAAIRPFELYNYGLGLDFEMRLKGGPGWLQFSNTFYYVSLEGDNPGYFYDGNRYYDYHLLFSNRIREPFSKLKGVGLNVNYKRFLDPKRGFYAAAGLAYHYFDIKYYGGRGVWNDYMEDGLQFHEYTYTLGFNNQYIHRGSINHYIGYQIPSRFMFLFDSYIGVSYRYAISDETKVPFNETSLSYGFSGFVFMTGIRIGIGIK